MDILKYVISYGLLLFVVLAALYFLVAWIRET
jgi:hypothetical protein